MNNNLDTKKFTDENEDIKVIKDFSTGSDAITLLINKNGEFMYRKIAKKSLYGGVEKLKEQLDWILSHENYIPLPKIDYWFFNGETCIYDMLTNPNSITMFWYLNNVEVSESWKLLKNALDSIKNLYNLNIREAEKQNVLEYIDKKVTVISDKLINKHAGKYIDELMQYDKLVINGKQYCNLKHFIGKGNLLDTQKLYNLFINDKCCDIHGDLTIENIVYNSETKPKFYFIDPNLGNSHETFLLDYAKLLQSLHGQYEFLQKTQNVEIFNNKIDFSSAVSSEYKEIYKLFDNYLKNNLSAHDYKSVYYHEIIHWLRLMIYKIKKDEKRAVIYYSEMIILMNELEQKFGG